MKFVSLVLVLVLALSLSGETVFPSFGTMSDGRPVSWYGSSTVFVGHYEWAPNRKPLSVTNTTVRVGASFPLATTADFPIVTCDTAANMCSTPTQPLTGGLPDGTEVKFITTGTLPGGLVDWDRDQYKRYYIRSWAGKSFQLSESPGGDALDLDDATPGSGEHGMSFAGYSHVMSLLAAGTAKQYVPLPDTDTFMVQQGVHGLNHNTMVWVHTTGTLPGGMRSFWDSRFQAYCVVDVTPTTFRLRRPATSVSSCTSNDGSMVDFTDTGSGTLSFYTAAFPVVTITGISGYPQGTVFSWRRNATVMMPPSYSTASGYGTTEGSTFVVTMFAKVPAVTPPGEYLIRVSTSESQTQIVNPNSFEYTLKAVGLTQIDKQGPQESSYTEIPGFRQSVIPGQPLRTWEAMMTSPVQGGGAEMGGAGTGVLWPRCPNRTDPDAPQGYQLPTVKAASASSGAMASSLTINHNLNTTDITIQCWRGAHTYLPLSYSISNQTNSSVTVTFPPTTYSTCYVNPGSTLTAAQLPTPFPMNYSASMNAQVWFYNDETFFKIANYTGDLTWANCGLYVANAMRDRFFKDGPAAMYGYFYFPWTLAAAYGWTGDPSYREAVIRIADGGNSFRGETMDLAAREHAFAFERRLARRAVTGEEDYHLGYFADAAIASIYINAIGSPERKFLEPFIMGLLMRPLIRWYAISHDERVPYVIKIALDKLWDDWYDKSNHRLFYNTEPYGERCLVSCREYTSSTLNNLVSPAFAWYWRLTGDDLYRDRGDDLFAYQYATSVPYFAKEWSQGYYWSWDYVAWRRGQQPAY